MKFRLLSRWGVVLGLLAGVTGCGGPSDAPETYPVTGVVNYKGKAISDLMVTFNPEGPGMIATGTTDADGKFSLMTSQPGDGAKAGTYIVAIAYVPESELGPEMPGFPHAPKKTASVIPKKYANVKTSGLKQTVEKDAAKNNFTFDLTD